jgi:hypothetical protein
MKPLNTNKQKLKRGTTIFGLQNKWIEKHLLRRSYDTSQPIINPVTYSVTTNITYCICHWYILFLGVVVVLVNIQHNNSIS